MRYFVSTLALSVDQTLVDGASEGAIVGVQVVTRYAIYFAALQTSCRPVIARWVISSG